jgi:DNA invertase Pin-like site-specific DNA recombinase
MSGQRVGYVRVSTYDQQTYRQLDGLLLNKIFTDKASGKDVNRPQLEALLDFVREGDTVIVHSMDRLARNLDDLRKIVRTLTKKGVCIEFVKESLQFKSENSPIANLMLSVMGAFAEFERSLIRERQREGIVLAQKRGAYKGRRRSLNNDQVKELMISVSETPHPNKTKIAKDFGISRETLYQYIRNFSGSISAQ